MLRRSKYYLIIWFVITTILLTSCSNYPPSDMSKSLPDLEAMGQYPNAKEISRTESKAGPAVPPKCPRSQMTTAADRGTRSMQHAPAIWLVTCTSYPDGPDDDAPLVAACAAQRLRTAWAVWDDPAVDWAAASVAVIRAT